MTKQNNWMVGEAYKPSKERRAELRETMKVWDLDDEFAWANNKPWWLLPLQVLGAMATGIGLVACIYYSTLILFLL
jgi:hypothetical protein